jgi:Fe-S-cluster containining protein
VADDSGIPPDINVCARCATRFGSCCTLTPGQEEYCFPLSAQERQRMIAAGAEPEHIARQENTDGFLDNLCRLLPGDADTIRGIFPLGCEHERLAITDTGRCRLLGDEGCRLPREARPLYCLLYPFWIRSGLMLYFEYDRCLALREGRGARALLHSLGMSETGVRILHNDLRKAWGLTHKP